jgi:hypothetical protein
MLMLRQEKSKDYFKEPLIKSKVPVVQGPRYPLVGCVPPKLTAESGQFRKESGNRVFTFRALISAGPRLPTGISIPLCPVGIFGVRSYSELPLINHSFINSTVTAFTTTLT